jgi:hypothetical protein
MLNYISKPIPPHCITPVHNSYNITIPPSKRTVIVHGSRPKFHQTPLIPVVEPTFSPSYTYSYPTLSSRSHPKRHRSLFNHAFNRIHEYTGGSFGPGVGMHEARHWHRRAYGGLVSVSILDQLPSSTYGLQGEINHMLPEEVGHAAAYEAYRTWIHHSSIYEPLGGDIERQRDGLIGLAIAEGEYPILLFYFCG